MTQAVPVIRTMLPAVRGELPLPRRARPAAPPLARALRPGPVGTVPRPRSGPTTRCCAAGCRPTSPGPRSPPSPPTPAWARDPGRGRLRLLAGGLPPVRPVARPRRRPGPDRRAGRAGSTPSAGRSAAAPRWPASTPRRAGPGRRHRGRRAHRGPAGHHRHRPEGRPARPARPAPRRPGPAPTWPPPGGATSCRPWSTWPPTACPPYPDARPGDWNGLQSFVDRLDDLTTAWAAAEARHLPDPSRSTPSPPRPSTTRSPRAGQHTVYLACPAAPSAIEAAGRPGATSSWSACLDDGRGPGPGLPGQHRRRRRLHARRMERDGRWPGAHPMYLDLALDQLGPVPTHPPARPPPHPRPGPLHLRRRHQPDRRDRRHAGRAAARALLADRT